jgi:hypothetical protein
MRRLLFTSRAAHSSTPLPSSALASLPLASQAFQQISNPLTAHNITNGQAAVVGPSRATNNLNSSLHRTVCPPGPLPFLTAPFLPSTGVSSAAHYSTARASDTAETSTKLNPTDPPDSGVAAPAPASFPSTSIPLAIPRDPSETPHYYVWSNKMSKARVYADVNVKRPREYWDYESLVVNWG